MIKIAHEAPKSIFKSVQSMTDYDYALVHLFEEDSEYFNLFQRAKMMGREIILDNSVFELEKAFDPERFVYWINRLRPTYYIVPDVLEDADGTIANMAEWVGHWKQEVLPGPKMIGVVQGKTYKDLVRCYSMMTEGFKVDKVAISFDYSYYRETVPHPNKLISWALGRVKLLGDFKKDGILRENIPHHLLGCGIPGEGLFYNSPDFDFIDSVDTSNPVLHGCEGIDYLEPLGLSAKSSTKLFTIMNQEVSIDQWHSVFHNIREFRRIWGGHYGLYHT